MLSEQLFLTLPPLLPEQDELQPPVPTVLGSIDYRTWRQRLERIDEILRTSRVEEAFIRVCLKRRLADPRSRCAVSPAVCSVPTQWRAAPNCRNFGQARDRNGTEQLFSKQLGSGNIKKK
jgi:hypothetical protein